MRYVIAGWTVAIAILITLIWWDKVHAATVYEQSGFAGTTIPQTVFNYTRLYDKHCVCIMEGDKPDEEVDDCDCVVDGEHEFYTDKRIESEGKGRVHE